MALADTAKLIASLSLGGPFNKQIATAGRSLDGFDKKLSDTGSRGYKAGQQIGTGIKNAGKIAAVGVGLLAAQVALGVRSLVELEQQEAQTAAVLKSTGNAAGITAEQVGRLAEKYEGLNATVGDEVIRSAENLLLTFTNVRKEAFEPALQAALDMNTALGKGPDGLTSTMKTLGKALNDPTKGLGALSKVGITFSKEQTDRIKALQKEGDLYGAQSIILAELDKRFKGSFLAQGNTTAGKVAKFTDSIEDLQRAMATALLPAIGNIADALTEILADPEIIQGAKDLGVEIGKLFSKENVKAGAKLIGDVFAGIKAAAPAVQAAIGTIGNVLGAAFKAFNSLPKEVQALLLGGAVVNKLTGGLITNIAGGIFGALKAMTVQAAVVNVSGPVAGLPGGGAAPGAGVAGAAGLGLVAAATALIGVAAAEIGIASIIAPDIRRLLGVDSATPGGAPTAGQTHTVIDGPVKVNFSTVTQAQERQTAATKAMSAKFDGIKAALEGRGDSGSTANNRQSVGDIIATNLAVDAANRTTTAVEGAKGSLKTAIDLKGSETKGAVDGAKLAIDGAKRATEIGSSNVAAAIRNKDLSVDLTNRTTVNVSVSATGVKTSTTYQNRVGKSTGSHGGSGAGVGYSGQAGGH